jgi:hypothetical protein
VLNAPPRMPGGAFSFRHIGPSGKRTDHVGASALPVLRLLAPE